MRMLLMTVAVVLSLSACSGTSSSNGDDKYTQTWSKSYGSTSCDDWNSKMTDAQQFAAAADMLTGARNSGDGGSGLPDDSLIKQFQGGVTTACVIPTAIITGIGADLYVTERGTFSP